MTSYTRDGTVGPWATEKLACLQKYLTAYTKILRNQSHWCRGYYYIDAFAGAGHSKVREKHLHVNSNGSDLLSGLSNTGVDKEVIQYIRGSPRIALDINFPFTHYFFIEQEPSRIESLKALKAEYGDSRKIFILEGDANHELKDKFLFDRVDWKLHRGVVFLDPFGLQVPWDTIELLAETRALEVLITFPMGMAIQRLLPRTGKMTSNQRDMLTRYLGSPEWEEIVYKRSQDLFGDQQVSKVSDAGHELVRWYQRRLKRIFGHGAMPRLIRNRQGGHLYYLLFAGPNATGAKIARHILGQGVVVT